MKTRGLIKIVVSGGIGAGKTSVLQMIQSYGTSQDLGDGLDGHVTVLYENVEAWQYLLTRNYEALTNGKPKEANTTTIPALLQAKVLSHYLEVTEKLMQLEEACAEDPDRLEVVVIERSPVDVVEIFMKTNRHAYTDAEYESLAGYCAILMNSRVWQKKVRHIVLDVDVETCMGRIRRRAREGENRIDASYMKILDAAYKELVRKLDGVVCPISVSAHQDQSEVARIVLREIRRICATDL
jgi:deoxyadenosine/deoxycytidine kinase